MPQCTAPSQSPSHAGRPQRGWPFEEVTLPVRGQGHRQTSSCRFAEEVPGTQMMLSFLFLILAVKGTGVRQVWGNILACCKVIHTVQASVTALDNLNEIINTRGLTLHGINVQYFEKKKHKGGTDRGVHPIAAGRAANTGPCQLTPASKRCPRFPTSAYFLVCQYSGSLTSRPILFPWALQGANANTRLFPISLWDQQSNQHYNLRDRVLSRLCSGAFCCQNIKHILGSVCP